MTAVACLMFPRTCLAQVVQYFWADNVGSFYRGDEATVKTLVRYNTAPGELVAIIQTFMLKMLT